MAENMRVSKSPSALEKLVPILLVLSVVLAFAVGILWQKVKTLENSTSKGLVAGEATNNQPPQAQGLVDGKMSEEQAKKVPAADENDPIRGNKNARVYIIEYSDLECPYCKKFHETMKQVMDEYGDKVAWVYRHFPLDQLHSKARTEALAVECAQQIGGNDGFWKYIDKIYEVTSSNDGLDIESLPKLASDVGLNSSKMKSCIDENKLKDRVEEEYQGGVAAGITGTPASFLVVKDGSTWFIAGAKPFESLKVTLDEALAEAK